MFDKAKAFVAKRRGVSYATTPYERELEGTVASQNTQIESQQAQITSLEARENLLIKNMGDMAADYRQQLVALDNQNKNLQGQLMDAQRDSQATINKLNAKVSELTQTEAIMRGRVESMGNIVANFITAMRSTIIYFNTTAGKGDWLSLKNELPGLKNTVDWLQTEIGKIKNAPVAITPYSQTKTASGLGGRY